MESVYERGRARSGQGRAQHYTGSQVIEIHVDVYRYIYVGQARWSLGGTGRYERGSAIAANRPHSFVPLLSPFASLTSFACLSLHTAICPLSSFLSLSISLPVTGYHCSPIYPCVRFPFLSFFFFLLLGKDTYDIALVKAEGLVTVDEPRKKA